MISSQCKIILNNYLLEIYDPRFQSYIILNEEYIVNLQDRLPRTSISTLNGRIRLRQGLRRNPILIDRKRKRTSSSFSLENAHLIIWLDYPENCREIKYKFHILTILDIARAMLDYELCIDDLIQTNSKIIDQQNHLNTFNNKDECLNFLKQVKSTIKILFITSNLYSEEIVPLIVQRVHMIYILVNDRLYSYEWTLDYISNLLIFHDNIHLLVRLIRDLAQNFFEEAQITLNSSVKQRIIFLKWAKQLFNRANEIDRPSFLNILNSINQQIETLELDGKRTQSDEDNEKFALECDEG
jgi:hypothetical protein